MNITVTFTGSGDAGMPDGSTLSFEDVDNYAVSTPADVEEIDCAAAGCDGCGAVHRRLTGTARLSLEASGRRQALLWKVPEKRGVRYWVAMADGFCDDPGAVTGLEEAGLRITEIGGRRNAYSRMVLIEDDTAPVELEGKEVELTLHRAGDGPVQVAKREVTA